MNTATDARSFSHRCTHGLKAGNCVTCPATRDAESHAWAFDALPMRGGRTLRIGGRTYRMNRHGIVCMHLEGRSAESAWDAFYHWENRCGLDAQASREYRDSIESAFAAIGVRASCGSRGYCSCPARF